MDRYVKKILEARVYDVATETPLEDAPRLSARLGNRVLLKREDLQPVFSFKVRGAYNKMQGLAPAARERGVITASAGNHAQGVALAAGRLGIRAVIVMGRNTPRIKVDAVRAYGVRVVLHGDTYDDASAHAHEIAEKQGMTYVHPYDDPDVIAGQGTIGMEILRQHTDVIDAIFVPVGGGGLIAGIGAYVKYLRPAIKVIGVEAQGSACLSAALERGRRVRLPADTLDLFADGVSVSQIGRVTWPVVRSVVDGVVTVSTDEICAAIKDVFEDTRSIPEPAGALGVAGLKKYVERDGLANQTLVAIESGANMGFDRLRHVSERAELGERREALLGVSIPEEPGSFRRFCRALGTRPVTEFNYRYAENSAAHVFVGVGIDPETGDRTSLAAELTHAGYSVVDLTDDEMAVLHVRHMVGGRGFGVKDERLFRFEFPERQGALLRFLEVLSDRWNISLFHYRNHGADHGRVLAGLQVKGRDRTKLEQYLGRIGYRWWDETGNPAYRLFLG